MILPKQRADNFKDKRSANPAQVLVVGAGPTGLLVAAELARRKIAVTIIDKRDHRQEISKALSSRPAHWKSWICVDSSMRFLNSAIPLLG